MEKVRSARQVVSAQLGGHVSSSTLSAHQMARAGEPVDSDGSIVWVRMHDGDTDQPYYWNRRTCETTWQVSRSSGSTRGVQEGVCGTGTRSLVSLHENSLRCLLGDGLRCEGLGIPSLLLGCHFWRSCSVSCCCLRSMLDLDFFWEVPFLKFSYSAISWFYSGYNACVSRRCFWLLFLTS